MRMRRVFFTILLITNIFFTYVEKSWANEFMQETVKHAPQPQSPLISPETTPEQTIEEEEEKVIWQGVSSSFSLPFEKWDEEKTELHWYDGLSGNLALGYPLLETPAASLPPNTTNGLTNNNLTATLSLKYSIIGNWFVSGTVYHYIDKEQQNPWNPDFTYVFGYSDWRPYTFSLLYSNYGGNRFNATETQPVTTFQQGTWSLGWKFPITKPFIDWLSFTKEGAIGCQVDFNYTHEYFDLASIGNKYHHRTVSLGCKYAITGNWYINGTAFHYLDTTQRQPWNPDFTYGFGYFDWRPGTITLQYNNYSGNRWHDSDRAKNTGRFIDGSITLAYSFAF